MLVPTPYHMPGHGSVLSRSWMQSRDPWLAMCWTISATAAVAYVHCSRGPVCGEARLSHGSRGRGQWASVLVESPRTLVAVEAALTAATVPADVRARLRPLRAVCALVPVVSHA
jgi:hypothetical protein